MKVITPEKIHDNFAILLEITDAELAFIEEDPTRIYNASVMQDLMKSCGKNAHIVQLTLTDGLSIAFYVYKLLNIYESVSWINEGGKFFIRRNATALLN